MGTLNPDFLKIRFQMVQFSNGLALAIVLTIQKTGPFEIRTFLSGFQIVCDNMAAMCPDYKWLGFRISDLIQNPDHFQIKRF